MKGRKSSCNDITLKICIQRDKQTVETKLFDVLAVVMGDFLPFR